MAKKNKKNIPRGLGRAGALCLAFANTGVPRRDDRRKSSTAPPKVALERYEDLVIWCQRMGVLDGAGAERLRRAAAERPQDAEAARVLAVRLRAAIVRSFTALALNKEPRSEDLATMNGLLRLRRAVPAGDGFRWDWAGDESALDRPSGAVAQSAAELLVSDDLAFVRQCAGSGCRQLFINRNGRRYWCDMNTCGNRAKGRRRRRFLRYAQEAALRPKPASGARPSSSAAAGDMAAGQVPTPRIASERLDDLQPTEGGGAERLVTLQPTDVVSSDRLDTNVTTGREPDEGLDALHPTVRKL